MKPFVDPLSWYLVLQCIGLGVLHRSVGGRPRQMVRGLAALTILLGVAALPLTGRGFEASLEVTPTSKNITPPAFIFVLGGGYVAGAHPEEDALVLESLLRVLYAVEVWRDRPTSRLVFSGGGIYGGPDRREAGRMADLMSQVAQREGVPAAAILLETRSRNTRQHPVEALDIPGVTSAAPIGIVTSAWHSRRARREFCRHFQDVQSYPVPRATSAVSWSDIFPASSSLRDNTTFIREWLGMFWYSVLARRGPARGRC